MKRIVVAAQDPVLAKKVRFLMERDDCEVEILPSLDDLEVRLRRSLPSVLVLSRDLGGEDAIDRLGRLDPELDLPPTLVLGGEPRVVANFIHLLPDPFYTQAIFQSASRMLAEAEGPMTDTHRALGALTDEDAFGGIAEELDALEAAEPELPDLPELLDEPLPDDAPPLEAVPTESDPMKTSAPPLAPRTAEPAPRDPVPLEPAAFARALHAAWSNRLTGALIIEHGDEQSKVAFDEGQPVHLGSNRPGDPLGRALVGRGRLSEAQYADAAKRVVETGAPLGDAIVALGFLDDHQLGVELATSAREALVECFARREGRFWTTTGPRPVVERPFRLEVGHVIALGLRSHAEDAVIDAILGERLGGYFRLHRQPSELQRDFPLAPADLDFLAFESRAYNLDDASEGAGLPLSEARRLVAILAVCGEVEPFEPTAREFEARIREERETRQKLESQLPRPGLASSRPSHLSPLPGDAERTRIEPPGPPPPAAPLAPPPAPRPSLPPSPPPALQVAPPVLPSPNGAGSAPPPLDQDIPAMPVPNPGEGVVPRPLVYAKPAPRGPEGGFLDTPERGLSREHFQRGVGLLGKGNFASAEEAFRDAVALCAEEHVYLIGLARALYYNPSYRADGKLPILRSIVDRAMVLAPDDKRVATLAAWVDHAEVQHT